LIAYSRICWNEQERGNQQCCGHFSFACWSHTIGYDASAHQKKEEENK